MLCNSCWRLFSVQNPLNFNASRSGRIFAAAAYRSRSQRSLHSGQSRHIHDAATSAEASQPSMASTDTDTVDGRPLSTGKQKQRKPKRPKLDSDSRLSSKSRGDPSGKLSASPSKKPKAEAWQKQKSSLDAKFPEGYSPRKRLSPDTLPGIRMLHASDPRTFSTPVLAEHFKVSSEAIRRILKSKWRPNDEQEEERRLRWDRRGERIWSRLAELGTRPPKKWRAMGVGRVDRAAGELPLWKQKGHDEPGEALPFVDEKSQEEPVHSLRTRFADRLLL